MDDIKNQSIESVPGKNTSENSSNGSKHDVSDCKNALVQKEDVCNAVSGVIQESDSMNIIEGSGIEFAGRDLCVIELETNESRQDNMEAAVQINGNHDCSSVESRNAGTGLQRLSSNDIYPDKEAEICQTSDNSSDEESEDVYGSQIRGYIFAYNSRSNTKSKRYFHSLAHFRC